MKIPEHDKVTKMKTPVVEYKSVIEALGINTEQNVFLKE